ncbi:MAG: hypothetical protein ABSB68_04800 [Acidimicrobiales bacterium]
MAMMTVVAGSVGLLAAGFVGRYAIWRHRAASSLQRAPVRADRPVHVVRERESGDGLA